MAEAQSSKIVNSSGRRKPPNAGKGRPKGSRNKVTTIAKDGIALAAEQLGGVDRLAAWAKEDPANERAFWTSIYTKLIPVQVNGPGEDGEHLVGVIERAIVKA